MRWPHVLASGFASFLLVPTILLAQEDAASSTLGELSRKAQGEPPEGEVQIRGILVNKSANYFTDQRLVLRDPNTGTEIYVRPWLPLSVGRSPSGERSSTEAMPPVQSDFLGKEVILKGHFATGQLKGVGTVDLLTVDEARIVSD
jgi:hypothetical protein